LSLWLRVPELCPVGVSLLLCRATPEFEQEDVDGWWIDRKRTGTGG
jgi:hypothetical protein